MLEPINESTVESLALEKLQALNYSILLGPRIAPDEPAAERLSFSDVVLLRRLRDALTNLNPSIPADALDEALRKATRPASPSLVANNRAFHRMLSEGVEIEYRRNDGSIAGDRALLVDFKHPERNDFLAVNQFTVIEGQTL